MKNNVITFKDLEHNEHFIIINYPDGQRSICLNEARLSKKNPVAIKCRLKNFSDLEILSCLIASLKKHDYYIESLEFWYLFGMRSDRSFNVGEPNYFRDVIAPVINSFGVRDVFVFSPHNDAVLQYINAKLLGYLNFLDIKNINCFSLWGDESSSSMRSYLGVTQMFDINTLGCFYKKREYGHINIKLAEKSIARLKNMNSEHPIMILDDLCDAGGTFIAEAQYLRDICGIKNPLHLFVAHGLFTKGLDPLLEHFEQIITTNSYQEIEHPNVKVIEVI